METVYWENVSREQQSFAMTNLRNFNAKAKMYVTLLFFKCSRDENAVN